MPYTRRKRYNARKTYARPRYNKRKPRMNNYRKRKRTNRPYTTKARTPSGVSDRMLMKMRYTTFFNITNVISDNGYHIFRGNSIYDPDLTFVGHQPLGHDQWAAFYDKYRVHASKINIQVLSRSNTTDNSNVIVVIFPIIDPATYLPDPVQSIEQIYGRYRVLGTANATNGIFMKNYMSTKKIYGETSLADDEFVSNFGSNPVSEWFWYVGLQNMQGFLTSDATFVCKVTYFVELLSRKPLPQS